MGVDEIPKAGNGDRMNEIFALIFYVFAIALMVMFLFKSNKHTIREGALVLAVLFVLFAIYNLLREILDKLQ